MDDLDHTGAPKRWDDDRDHLAQTSDMTQMADAMTASDTRNARYRQAVSIILTLAQKREATPELLADADAFVAALLEEGTK